MTKAMFCVILLMSLTACLGDIDSPDQHRVCVNSSANVCIVPVFALFTHSRIFDGENVATQGYLKIQEDGIYLYPTLESMKYREIEASIEILSSEEYVQGIEREDGRRVLVVGRYGITAPRSWGALTLANIPHEVPIALDEKTEALDN